MDLAPGGATKKRGNGCAIALGLLCAFGVLVFAAVAFGVYRVASTKEGKAAFTLMGESVGAHFAPGTDELRALGCDQAMAMDFDRVAGMVGGNDGGALPSDAAAVMVMCQVGFFGDVPSCDDVARVYSKATRGERSFVVTVRAGVDPRPRCVSRYDAGGQKLGDVQTER